MLERLGMISVQCLLICQAKEVKMVLVLFEDDIFLSKNHCMSAVNKALKLIWTDPSKCSGQ